jgi:copper(I)-binding protein
MKGTTTMWRTLATLLLLLPVAASAQPASITVEQAWSRAAMAGREGVAYMTITNAGPTDTLTAVSTPIAATADLHQTINDNGVMKMRAVQSLPIDTGKTVTLAPRGYHIMLTNLKQTLQEGDSFPITLTFQNAGEVTATAKVEKAGATSPPASGMSDHMNMPMSGNKP